MKNILRHRVRRAADWVLRQPAVRKVREDHPKLVAFVANRFDTNFFIGLPLTLVLVAAGANIALLSQLTESVVDSEWVVQFDEEFTSMLYNMRTEWVSQVFYTFTQLGNREFVFIAGGIVSAIFLFRRKWIALVSFWLMLGGVGLSVQFGKKVISRDRPTDVAYYVVEHFSFPSGHATTIIALYGLIAYFLYRHFDKSGLQRLTVVLAVLLIVLVGFSRIYLGVHYLSDVLAGYLLGGLWLLVGISMVEVLLYRKQKRERLHG